MVQSYYFLGTYARKLQTFFNLYYSVSKKPDYCYFRWAIQAHRHSAAQARVDIERLAAFCVFAPRLPKRPRRGVPAK